MGTCICCGAETPGNYRLCKECDSVARTRPCLGCKDKVTLCHSDCKRHAKWVKCHAAVKKLEDERRKQDVKFRRRK